MYRHMKFHKGVRPWVCPHEGCTKSFVLKQNLMDHVRRHKKVSSSLPYKCNTCQLTFADFTAMAEHRAQKHPEVVSATSAADYDQSLDGFGAGDVLIGQSREREGEQGMIHIGGEGLKGGESFMQHYELGGGESTRVATHNGWH